MTRSISTISEINAGAVPTGYYVREGYIWGPDSAGEYWIDGGYIWGPQNAGKYRVENGHIYGHGQHGEFFICGQHIYGPSNKLPWLK